MRHARRPGTGAPTRPLLAGAAKPSPARAPNEPPHGTRRAAPRRRPARIASALEMELRLTSRRLENLFVTLVLPVVLLLFFGSVPVLPAAAVAAAGSTGTDPKKRSRTTGSTRVTKRFSRRRLVRRSSISRAEAILAGRRRGAARRVPWGGSFGARAGDGFAAPASNGRVGAPVPGRRACLIARPRLRDQLEESLLQRAAGRLQLREEEAALLAPVG